jgi:hypothetical protein
MKSTSLGEGRSGLDYLAEHIWQALLDFLVSEVQDMYATLLQKLRTLRIMSGLFSVEVNAAIDLDSQLTFDTEKVENELPVRMLSPKLKARQLPVTQSRPKPHFRRSLSLPQLARSTDYRPCCFAAYRLRHGVVLLPSPANAFFCSQERGRG